MRAPLASRRLDPRTWEIVVATEGVVNKVSTEASQSKKAVSGSRERKWRAKEDLPVAMPPVRARQSMECGWGEAGGKGWKWGMGAGVMVGEREE